MNEAIYIITAIKLELEKICFGEIKFRIRLQAFTDFRENWCQRIGLQSLNCELKSWRSYPDSPS